MKKQILGILLAILMIASVFALTSCDAILDTLRKHDWSEWEIKTAADSCEDRIYHRHCFDCEKVETKKGSHEYTENYLSDNASHWYGCKHCAYQKGEAKHNMSNDACTSCGYTTKPTEGIVYEVSTSGTYAYVSSYEGDDSYVVIASEYEGVPVTTLYERAFEGCEHIVNVVLPDSITSIDSSAFHSCYNLTSINIPNSVTFVGKNAFYGCYKLNGIFIDDISAWCNITFEPSETDGRYQFDYNFGVELSASTSHAHLYLNYKVLTELTIPDNVDFINEEVFAGRSCLTSVTIGNNVTGIDDAAFAECNNLKSVTIVDSVTSIGQRAFERCNSLTNATIGKGITSISKMAFYDCPNLTSVTIGDNVTTIEDSAFYNCDSLVNIVIPNRVTTIGDDAFYNCDGFVSVIIPDTVTKIGSGAFMRCKKLTNIVIGNRVSFIGNDAFSYCSALESITVNNNLMYYSVDNCLIEKYTGTIILGCKNSVIPKYVVYTIGNSAFLGCSELTNITIPNSVTTIEDYAFQDCSSLTSVVIPDSVTSIGSGSFSGCYGLTDVYYTGSEEDWAKISIGSSNSYFIGATIHYNYVPEE